MESAMISDDEILRRRFSDKTQVIAFELGRIKPLNLLYSEAENIEEYERKGDLGSNADKLIDSMKKILKVTSRSTRIEAYQMPDLPEGSREVWNQFRELSINYYNDVLYYHRWMFENRAGFRKLHSIYRMGNPDFKETKIFSYWDETLEQLRDEIEMILHALIQGLILVYESLEITLLREESALKQRLIQDRMMRTQQVKVSKDKSQDSENKLESIS